MSGEKISIEVDSSFIQNFFGLADMMPPENITTEELNNVIKAIKQKTDNLLLAQSSLSPVAGTQAVTTDDAGAKEFLKGGEIAERVIRPKSVLIVDDLGIITFQLEILFKKIGFETVISKELYDAIDKYKKKDFGYVILDLFIPTEREGLLLVDEIKKLALFCKLNTKIIMMSASAKAEFKDKCLSRGADCYIEKTSGWQKNIIEACLSNG